MVGGRIMVSMGGRRVVDVADAVFATDMADLGSGWPRFRSFTVAPHVAGGACFFE